MRSLNVVAHPDDDLLFLNPDILQDDEQLIIYLTMGDDGNGSEYINKRRVAADNAWQSSEDCGRVFIDIASSSFRTGDVYGKLYDYWTNPSAWTMWVLDQIRNLAHLYTPDIIRTHDPDAEPAIDHDEPHFDHIDHIYTAKFVQEAAKAFSNIPVYAYMGYPIRYQAPNVSPELTQQKLAMWRKYQEIDTSVAGEQWDIAMSRCYKRRIQ